MLFENDEDCTVFECVLAEVVARELPPIFVSAVMVDHLRLVMRLETERLLFGLVLWLTLLGVGVLSPHSSRPQVSPGT